MQVTCEPRVLLAGQTFQESKLPFLLPFSAHTSVGP